MSLLPVFVQPPRARSEATPSAPVERRSAEGPNDAFADSLASARGDETRASGDDAVTTKTRLAAQQRARLQSLMLSGAMKFAVTRNDVTCESRGSDGRLASLPATPDDNAAVPVSEGDVLTALSVIPMLGALVPQSAPAVAPQRAGGAQCTEPSAAAIANPSEIIAPAQAAVEMELVSPTLNEPAIDASMSSAATVAAMQLVATLPLPALTESLPDAPAQNNGTIRSSAQSVSRFMTNESAAQLTAELTPSTSNATAVLVEDHFDASAAALEAALTGAAPVRVTAVPSDVVNVTATPVLAKPAAVVVPIGVDRAAVERDIARLDPAFRERLERVMERMQKEFGHDVSVVETVRTQARQNALYAQGRTAPGQVVTWTKNSKHGKGLAADLMVDSEWNNPQGYAHLAEIARQEGLRTLGARDPGHVELAGESGVSNDTLGSLLGDLQGEAGDSARQLRATVSQQSADEGRASAMARVANVAQVARVATVASVAKVAEVATPGASARERSAANDSVSPLAVSGATPMMNTSDLSGTARVVAPSTAVNMAERISHLMDLQATQASKPLNSVLLRMDNASGIEDQIRIDTRGTSVDARLGLGNAQQAAALTDRLGELREALERRGLTADGVRVQAATGTRTTDNASFSRTTAPVIELAAMRAASDSQAQGNTRDQSARDQQQREAFARDQSRHTPRSSSDDTRQRSRREQPEDRR